MRGKLRDKRSYSKYDLPKREGNEPRRPYKRDPRSMVWDTQQMEDDEYTPVEDDLLADEEDVQMEVRKLPR